MFHTIFEKAAIDSPDRPALQYEDNKPLSYAELDSRANKMAHVFLEHKITPQSFVAVRLPRSTDQVVAMLALLKIGAVYVPVSLAQSTTKLGQVINSCRCSHVITLSNHIPEELSGAKKESIDFIALDQEAENIESQSSKKPEVAGLTPQNLAYVTYSSGTTGKPKGIPIRHAGLEYWRQTLLNVIKHKVTHQLANSSVDFDAHIFELLMGVTAGATTHITSEETRKDIQKLGRFINKHHISDATLTPPVLRSFNQDHIKEFRAHGLQAIVSTGEACTSDIVSMFNRHGVTILNGYGPSEATIGFSLKECVLKHFYRNMAPIGKPFGDQVKARIVNEQGQEVAEGEAGELIIESPYLMSEYLGQDSSNKIFEEKTGQGTRRWYATGDKFIQQGDHYYYVERLNHLAHTKIRGQLVVPGGVERYFRENYPEYINDICVVVKERKSQDALVVAYIVAHEQATPISEKRMRADCEIALNAASVPSYFCFIEKLPLNTSGKVDRALLSQQKIDFQRDKDMPYKAPQTELEKVLSKVWKKILPVDEVLNLEIGVSDIFAVFGGSSICAARLAHELSEIFGVSIPLPALGSLEELTIEKLTGIIKEYLCKGLKQNPFIEMVKKGSKELPPLFLLPPISGESILVYAKLVQSLTTERSIYVLNADCLTASQETFPSIPEIAAIYLALVRSVYSGREVCVAGWSSGAVVAAAICAQLERENQAASYLGVIDEIAPQFVESMDTEMFATQLVDLLVCLGQFYGFEVGKLDPVTLGALPKNKQIESVFKELKQPTSRGAQAILKHVESFLMASLNYKPPKLKNTSVSVYSSDDTRQRFSCLTPSATGLATLGWREYAKNFNLHELKGDHFSIVRSPEKIAGAMDEDLIPPDSPKLLPVDMVSPSDMKHDFSSKLTSIGKHTLYKTPSGIPFAGTKSSPVIKSIIPAGTPPRRFSLS